MGLKLKRRCKKATPSFYLFNRNLNISRIGADLADTADRSFGNVDASGIGFGNKHLFGKKTSLYVAGVGFDMKLGGVASFKLYVTGASFKRKAFRCYDVGKGYGSGTAV